MLDRIGANLERYMDLLSARQKVVTSNIANADTPGYKTRDIDFQFEYMSQLEAGHSRPLEVDGLATRNDGNNVSLDREARLLAENALASTWLPACFAPDSPGAFRHSGGQKRMSLFSLLSVSASGMSAQRTRAELLVENLANAETTRTPEGGPYRRKDAVFTSETQSSPFSAVFQQELGGSATGVRVAEIVEDQREPDKRFLPGHPDAERRRLCRVSAHESRRGHG